MRAISSIRSGSALFKAMGLKVLLSCCAGGYMPESSVKILSFDAEGTSYYVEYLSNASIAMPSADVRSLVVAIHGHLRDARGCYAGVCRAAASAGERHALIIAPRFPLERDLAGAESGLLFWSNDGWKQGDESLSSSVHIRNVKVSSFDVVDTLIANVVDSGNFPGLVRIVLVGHSAGGQFVNRYSVGSEIQERYAEKGIEFRYVVANPSSYLYIDSLRPVAGKPGSFVKPHAPHCPRYNHYKYGLEKLNSYMSRVGILSIRNSIPNRRTLYLLGGADTSHTDTDLDRSCSAMLQGGNRLERGRNYQEYLALVYGKSILDIHRFIVVPDVGHSYAAMFRSPMFLKGVFGQ